MAGPINRPLLIALTVATLLGLMLLWLAVLLVDRAVNAPTPSPAAASSGTGHAKGFREQNRASPG